MPWVKRIRRFQGSSSIALERRERTCYHLVILLRCIYWPLAPYTNKDWIPERSHYGRLTGFSNYLEYRDIPPEPAPGVPSFVRETRNLYYPSEVVYDRSLPLSRLQNIHVEGTRFLYEQLSQETLPVGAPTLDTAIQILFYLSNLFYPETPDIAIGQYAVAPHEPNRWVVKTHPESLWEWSILSFLSDDMTETTSPDDGDGDGENEPPPPPPPELPDEPPLDFPLDEPPGGSDPGLFDQEVPPYEPPDGGGGGTFGFDGEFLVFLDFRFTYIPVNRPDETFAWGLELFIDPPIAAPVEIIGSFGDGTGLSVTVVDKFGESFLVAFIAVGGYIPGEFTIFDTEFASP